MYGVACLTRLQVNVSLSSTVCDPIRAECTELNEFGQFVLQKQVKIYTNASAAMSNKQHQHTDTSTSQNTLNR
jgi:hypothetical protein